MIALRAVNGPSSASSWQTILSVSPHRERLLPFIPLLMLLPLALSQTVTVPHLHTLTSPPPDTAFMTPSKANTPLPEPIVLLAPFLPPNSITRPPPTRATRTLMALAPSTPAHRANRPASGTLCHSCQPSLPSNAISSNAVSPTSSDLFSHSRRTSLPLSQTSPATIPATAFPHPQGIW